MRVNYPQTFAKAIKKEFGENSKYSKYVNEGDLRLGAALSSAASFSRDQSCFIKINSKTKEREITAKNEFKEEEIRVNKLYDSWIEIVESEYDRTDGKSKDNRRRKGL